MKDSPQTSILIVDDDADCRLAMKTVLEGPGRNLVLAASGKEALREVLRQEFAVILLDVRMPKMDGFELAELIRRRPRLQRVPLIFITAESSEVARFKGYALGAVDYLVKPFVLDVLRSKVDVFVDLFEKTEEVKRQAEQIRQFEQRAHAEAIALEQRATQNAVAQYKLAEESRRMLVALVENANDFIAITNTDGQSLYLNEAGRKLIGLDTVDDALRCAIDDWWPEKDRARNRAILEQLCAERGSWRGEMLLHNQKTAEAIPVFASLFAITHLENGESILVASVCRDIRELTQTTDSLHRERAVLAAVNSVFQQALACETDQQVGRLCLAVAEELTGSQFGYIGELNEKGLFGTIAISNIAWDACRMPQTQAMKLLVDMPLRGIDRSLLKQGVSRIVNDPISHPDYRGTPVNHPIIRCFLGVPLLRGGKTVGMIGLANKKGGYTLEDQRAMETLAVPFMEALWNKRAEIALRKSHDELELEVQERTAALVQSNRSLQDYAAVIEQHAASLEAAAHAKTEFLANMSHELRTPLNAVIGFSEGLLERTNRHPLNEHQTDRLRKIKGSGEHLLELINGLLDMSKMESGQMDVDVTTFPVAPLAAEIGDIARVLLRDRPAVQYRLDMEDDLPPLVSDRARIRQALVNLVSNAAKYTLQGSVTLRIRRAAESLLMTVEDTGIGIPEDQLDRIFEKFYQGRQATYQSMKGTGLGLSICKSFAELLGGSVTVHSVVGQGSSFTLALPLAYDAWEQTQAREITEQVRLQCLADDKSRPAVLCVERDPALMLRAHEVLAEAGYRLIPAFDDNEALILAASQHPRVILLDVTLPGLDGWRILRRIKANPTTSRIPVVVSTTLREKDLGLCIGADEYVMKPIGKPQFLEAVQRVLRDLPMGQAYKVAIVDDDTSMLRLVTRLLETANCHVRAFTNGEEFLAALDDWRPDAVILDLLMPGMDGFEVAERLRETPAWREIPIIIMTGLTLSEDDLARLSRHASAILEKGGLSYESMRRQLLEQLQRVTKVEPDLHATTA